MNKNKRPQLKTELGFEKYGLPILIIWFNLPFTNDMSSEVWVRETVGM